MISYENLHHEWSHWLTQKALPLWSQQGFNTETSLFHERLTWGGQPIPLPQLRLMVQARQIATYCRAEIDGHFYAGDKALACLEMIEKLYWRRDGKPGWIFSINPSHEPVDTTRDLYAHAFILYAYAWAYRLTQNAHYRNTAKEIFNETLKIFSASTGGFWDTFPIKDTIRRQNPHMHFLEACLALFETTQDDDYLQHAHRLITLAQKCFINPHSHLLLEFFTSDLAPLNPFGSNRVEPGHMLEWSWLLHEYIRLAPNTTQHQTITSQAHSLQAAAEQYGITQNHVLDAINDVGSVQENSLRIWPQTEFLRLLHHPSAKKRPSAALHCSQILTQYFLQETLSGGWIDRLHSNYNAISNHMPASSLYHIYGAAREILIIHKQ
ncbi:AGE family epimerase/isomerase [Neokomagataea anthophila]|uniref:AGE family epimerase/isomerase n=1 Tax=Neokomagataea anthophila TaxID=2826925 RepID=A0ABS5E801_9PROT|nr:AGE family epimerase/isomerase [Neokomagataea anthophila]MBR0560001.1 AGE family epimerase/isomerase [Neokomagataea anthophila]